MRDGHGDDLHRFEHLRANFSSNVTQLTDPTPLRQHLRACIDTIGSYPEPTAESLADRLAYHHHVDPASILVTNGATEAIYLVAQAYRARKHLFFAEPTFCEYRDAVALTGATYEVLQELHPTRAEAGSIYWLCSPNNPTGRSYPLEVLQELWQTHPEVLFVLDNSYAYFSSARQPEMGATMQAYPNVLFISSLTKRYAMPGLRLGYLLAHPSVIATILPYRQPWSVGTLAIEAGKWIVQHDFPSLLDKERLQTETKRLQQAIAALPYFEIETSDTHFFLIRCLHPTISSGDALKIWLATRHHLLVRDATNFGYAQVPTLRIATQLPEANDLLIQALTELSSLLY